ncbi:MAG: fibronectin type III domain-containing protein [bacterium]
MKKIIIYILIAIASFSFLSAKELLNFSIENRSSESGEYKADLFVDITDGSWEVGPCTIVIKYNTDGLIKKNTAALANIDSELGTAGYYLTQSSFSDGELAINIIASDQNVTKSGKIRICTIDWEINDGDQLDNLQFDDNETVIYKALNLMDYNCSTSNCFTLTNPTPQRIIPRMDPPTLINPSNTAIKVNLFVDFDWQNIAEAEGYEIQISDKSDFSTILVSTTTTTDLYSLAKGTLDYNKTYYWRVRAYNTDETTYWSNIWSFTTRSPLAKVTNLNPADLATGIKLNPILSYSAVTDADSYQIQLSDVSNLANLIIDEEVSGTELTSSTKLDFSKKYYWRVLAKDNFSEEGPWSDIIAFTTKNPLGTPVALTPNNGSTNEGLKPEFTWNSLAGAIGYRLQISKTDNFSTLERDISGTATNHTLSSSLDANVKYYWRLIAWDSDKDSSSFSTVWNFTTRSSLEKVTNLNPSDMAVNIKLHPKLSFSSVSGADSYLVQVSIVNNFSSYIINEETSGTELTSATMLNYYTKYYWRVRAKNNFGDMGPWSDTLEFTTKTQIGTPVALSPSTGSTNEVLKTEFTWNSLEGAIGYRLQLSKSSSFTSLERDISVTSTNHTLTTNLDLLTKYYWRLKAWDSDKDSSSYSTVWNFTTLGLKAPVLQSPANSVAFVPINTSFSWLAADDAESYKIQISKSATFTTVDFESVISSTSYTPASNLVAGKNYYWRVLSKTGSLESAWSSANQFSTDFDITLVKPSNNTTNVTRKNIQFQCQQAELADAYIFQAARDASFTDKVFEVSSSTNTIDYSYLNRNTKYYWKVKPQIGSEFGDWSTSWYFTTEEFNGPTLTSPANNTVDWEPSFELKWASNSEATKGYDIQIAQSSNFSDVEYEVLNNSSTSYTATELDRGVKYYWRVRTVNDNENSAWSTAWNFTTDIYDVPADWNPSITGKTHTVRIPSSINPKVVGRALRKGDVIGAFYKDGSETKCCGYVVWNKVTANMTVYGDDPETSPKEGYLENDLLEYKLFDCLTNKSYDAIVKYSGGPDVFTIDGTSVISELKTALVEQNMVLSKGWNIISTNINLNDNDIPDIWSGFSTNLVIMKDVSGKFYIPGKIDQLKKWNKNLGYMLYMSYADKLTVSGSNLLPDTVNISLPSGWSMVSYLRNSELDAPTALATIHDNLVIAKDVSGKFYLPSTGTNTIGSLKMGQGYKLYMKTADVLTYPANGSGRRNIDNTISKVPVRLIPEFGITGNNAALIIAIDAPDDSEIGLYNSNNQLVGSGVVEAGLVGITIIGDDEMTEITDGAKPKEILNAKILLANDSDLIDIETQAIASLIDGSKFDNIIYQKDEVLSANSKITSPTIIGDELSIYPNPTEKNIFIDLKTDYKNEQVIITIYTEDGKLVHTILGRLDNDGNLISDYSTANIASGGYLVKIEINKTILNYKFIKK